MKFQPVIEDTKHVPPLEQFADIMSDFANLQIKLSRLFKSAEAADEPVTTEIAAPVRELEPDPEPQTPEDQVDDEEEATDEIEHEPPVTLPAGKILAIDVENLRLYGPLGEMSVTRPMAMMLVKMQDGGVYDVTTLVEFGEWMSERALRDHVKWNRGRLADIGIDFVDVNKFMYRVRRLEA